MEVDESSQLNDEGANSRVSYNLHLQQKCLYQITDSHVHSSCNYWFSPLWFVCMGSQV